MTFMGLKFVRDFWKSVCQQRAQPPLSISRLLGNRTLKFFLTNNEKLPMLFLTVVSNETNMSPLKFSPLIRCSSKVLLSNSMQFKSSLSSPSQNESLSRFRQILSDENKQRVQHKIKSVQPIRTTKDIPLRDGHNMAAVLVPMCLVHNEPSLLLTLRSRKLSNHRGQVSFPGGHMDETDPDLAFTALRETQEELGIDPSVFDIWGQMNPLPTTNGETMVYPILARTGEIDISSLRSNESEVEEVFTVTLEHLCHPDNVGSTRFRTGSSYTLPVYTGAKHRIWGLTAVMIHQLLSMIAADLYKFKLRHKRYYNA